MLILTLVVAVVVGKFLTGMGAVLAAGAPFRSAILSGIAIAQVGEFAFILAQQGQHIGILSQKDYNIFLAVSVLTMIITPFIIQWSPKIARRSEAFQRLHQILPGRMTQRSDDGAGFLVAGTVVGPYGLNLISDREQVQVLAEVGIVLLLFTIGLEFSLAHLKSSKNLFLIGGPVQEEIFGDVGPC